MAVKFKIEHIFKITGRGYFIGARMIEKGNSFWLTENSKLGDIEITTFSDKLRAKDKEGNLRTDLWAFQLKRKEDFDKLKEGEIVELLT